jgi:acyl carrier protein
MSTIERLRGLLARDFDIKPELLQPETTLESLDIDSLRMIEIMFAIEDEFKMTVTADPAELKGLTTLADLARFIDAHGAKSQAT